MTPNNDYATIFDKDTDKPSETFRFRFYSEGKYAYITISPRIIAQLKLSETDIVSQSVTEDGAIILRRISRT